MKLDIQSFGGESSGSVELTDAIYGLEPRADLPPAHGALAAGQAPGRDPRGQEPG